MSNHTTEEMLLAGMERFTADVTAPPEGLAAKAAKHHRRHRIAKSAATGGTVVTAAAVIAAVAVAGPAPTSQQAQTTAYVVGRTESALATSSQNLVESGRVTTSDGFFVVVLGGGTIAFGVGPSPSRVTSMAEWAYGQRTKVASSTAEGKVAYVSGTVAIPANRLTTTLVDYQRKAWTRQTSSALFPMPKGSACARARAASYDFLGLNSGDIEDSLRAALRCGQYTLAGTQRVDGVAALKLTPVPSADRFASVTFWVDPASYLPVRSVATFDMPKKNAGRVQVDFRWLRPTAANVAKLAITIPPGFTREPTLVVP